MDEKYYTYVLYSDSSKQLYIGQTKDIERRLKQHNKGKVESTKPYIPYKLVYYEELNTKEEAIKREKDLKQANGRRFIKRVLDKNIMPGWRNW